MGTSGKMADKMAGKRAATSVESRRRRLLWVARWVFFAVLLIVGTVLMLGQMSHKSSGAKDPAALIVTRHWA
jgi:hypothetical protein